MYNFKSILLIINKPLETIFFRIVHGPKHIFFASIKPYNYFFPFLRKYA